MVSAGDITLNLPNTSNFLILRDKLFIKIRSFNSKYSQLFYTYSSTILSPSLRILKLRQMA